MSELGNGNLCQKLTKQQIFRVAIVYRLDANIGQIFRLLHNFLQSLLPKS